jgi:hypothetical protein
MTGTIPRPRNQPNPVARAIREVCLLGSRRRIYVHFTPGGLEGRESAPRRGRDPGTG